MNMKKKLCIILCIIFTLSINVFASSSDIVKPEESNGYVLDQYNILTQEDIDYINNTNNDLKNKTNGQVAVVLIKSLGDYDIETYSRKVFEEWKIGDSKLDNGTLLLISLGDKKIRIETGYGSEGPIPDGYAGRIINMMGSNFKQGSPDGNTEPIRQGILEGYNAILEFYEKEYGIEIENERPVSENQSETENGLPINMIFIIIAILIIMNSMNGPRNGRRRRRRYYNDDTFPPFWGGFGGSGFGGGGFGGGFGGFGGGSSGGGGFSGGGGSSGGGGASGGW